MRKEISAAGEPHASRCDENSLKNAASKMIRGLGVPAHYKGYQYLKSGIVMSAMDMDCLNDLTKVIYPAIAKKHHTGIHNVERTIRYAIERTWKRGNQEALRELFGYSGQEGVQKPTNKEFIATVADKLQMEDGSVVLL